MKKAQITMEFLFVIGFVFVLSVGLIAVAGHRMKEFSDKKQEVITNEYIDVLKKELDIASVVKIGYSRTITLPQKIDGTINYTIQMNSSAIIITTNLNSYTRIIPTTQGVLKKGQNIIRRTNTNLVIENV